MRQVKFSKYLIISLFVLTVFTLTGTGLRAQNIKFGVFADPLITWFASDTKETVNKGSRPGFNFGVTFNRYFGKNYSFSTGVSLMNAGGRLTNTDTVSMVFTNFTTKVAPGEPMIYKIQYLNIPLGLKFESNQIGYTTIFTDIGLDAKVVLGGKVDIPSEEIKKETASNELKTFNFGYHLMAGIEYSLGGNTEMVFGLGYEHNFPDITKDNAGQPVDKIMQNIFRFRIGVNF
jgi:opacity protein-like surface antigen